MMDIKQIMQQAQEFQQKMVGVQEELAGKQVSSSVGGGMVTATVNGKSELVQLKIEKDVIDPTDPEMLQDLVVAAVNQALRQSQDMARSEMAKLTGGLNIPGIF